MITEQAQKVDLHCPKGWNQCTTWELEQIAAALILATMQTDRYHPFDLLEVKLKSFLAINRLEVMESTEEGFLVRIVAERKHWWQRGILAPSHLRTSAPPFQITTAHLHAIISEYFTWLDDDKADPLMRPPYEGISPLLDGVTWQDYRLMQDWMTAYTEASNRLLNISKSRNVKAIADTAQQIAKAKKEFLAILLPKRKKAMSDIEWQVVLFWWSGLMKYLQKQYPRCFKSEGKPKKGAKPKRSNPLELYTRTTATMEKYLGLNEQEVNTQSAHVVLQHLEDMAREAEEMKKIQSKHK